MSIWRIHKRLFRWQALLTAAVLGAVLMAMIRYVFTTSAPFSMAMAELRNSVLAEEILGNPIAVGWVVSGSMKVTGSNGRAALTIPLSGTKSRGTLKLAARKSGGGWVLTSLTLESRRSGRVRDLLIGKQQAAE